MCEKECISKGWCTNLIDFYIEYLLRLKKREKDKVNEEGYRELEGPRESQGQVVMR